MLGFHMEIRGVGIIDIQSLSGSRAVRLQSESRSWSVEDWYERHPWSASDWTRRITGILHIVDPARARALNPGKKSRHRRSRAMSHLHKYAGGYRPSIQRTMIERIRTKAETESYLEEDTSDGAVWVVVAHGGLAEGLCPVSRAWRASREICWPLSKPGLGGEEGWRSGSAPSSTSAARAVGISLSDMDGGSCGQACRRLLASGSIQAVFFGVNLPLLVEFAFLRDEPFERFMTMAVDKARAALGAHR